MFKESVGQSPQQEAFVYKENRFTLPVTNILQLPEVVTLFERLPKRRLWQEKSEGNMELIDLRFNQAITYKNKQDRWETQIDFTDLRLSKNSLAALIIVAPAQNAQSLQSFAARLTKATDYLHRNDGLIVVLEEREGNCDIQTRKTVLKNTGLVKTSVLTPKTFPYLIWEARKLKEHRGLNLTLIDDFWKTLQLVIKGYQTAGWEVILPAKTFPLSFINFNQVLSQLKANPQHPLLNIYQLPEIIKHCQKAKNPPEAVASLIAGYGLTVRNNTCSCVWQINNQGTEKRIISCHDKDCQAPVINLPAVYTIGTTTSDVSCFDHNKTLIYETELLRKKLFCSEISVTYYCPDPNCEYKDRKKIWALNAQIKF